MRSIVWLTIILITPIIASPLQSRQAHRYHFDGCDAGQQAQLEGFLDDMQALAQAAVAPSEAANGGSAAFRAWFGSSTSGVTISDEAINTRFHKMARFKSAVPKKDVTFSCGAASPCCFAGQGAVPACGQQPGDDYVHICNPFWNWHQKQRVYQLAPPSQKTSARLDEKYRPRAYILLHELMHSQFGALDVVFYKKDDWGKAHKIIGYGHGNCLDLALSSARDARRNADTYALFATAAYYGGVDLWETNPGSLQKRELQAEACC